MLVPLSWLQEFISLDHLSPEKIGDVLTLAGLEVDRIERQSLPFQGVVVCKILECSPHPDSDRLQVATVFDGNEYLQIVCGAPNCRAGIQVPLARIGSSLTDAEGKVKIMKKGTLRGVDSHGMLCSSQELGLDIEQAGILEMSQHLSPGKLLSEIYGDTIFEISLTPNLGHCLSIKGIARELSALLQIPLKTPPACSINVVGPSIQDKITLSIEAPDDCPFFSLRLISNLQIQPSPAWIRARLKACNMRSINNIVDVTNYVMLELGQPLHVFDFNKLESKLMTLKIIEEDTPLHTLDNATHVIPKGSLVTFSGDEPVCITGVMGGFASAVDEFTTDVLLEAACFHSSSIRKTSRSMHLRSESSSRFEKGIDPKATLEALNRAAYLLQEIAGGQVSPDYLSESAVPYVEKTLFCRPSKICNLLGIHLSFSEIESIFQRLGITVLSQQEDGFQVKIPSHRNDVSSEIDLVEEVARIYGYNNIVACVPKVTPSNLPHHSRYHFEKKVRQSLIVQGLQEFLTCDLIGPKLLDLISQETGKDPSIISVLQPSSVDQSILRPSLLPGLLTSYALNCSHQRVDVAAFEIGQVHYKKEGQYQDRFTLGILLAGKNSPPSWKTPQSSWDFFELKGIVENFLASMGIANSGFLKSSYNTLHPGRQSMLKINECFIGCLGEVHPSILAKLDLVERVYFAEIDLEQVFAHIKPNKLMTSLPQFPGSERDWTLSIKKGAPVGDILQIIRSIHSKLLEEVELLSLYEHASLGVDRMNVTFRFAYRDRNKTLDLAAVEKEHHRLGAILQEKIKEHLPS